MPSIVQTHMYVPTNCSISMLNITNPDQYCWHRYSGPLYSWPILLEAVLYCICLTLTGSYTEVTHVYNDPADLCWSFLGSKVLSCISSLPVCAYLTCTAETVHIQAHILCWRAQPGNGSILKPTQTRTSENQSTVICTKYILMQALNFKFTQNIWCIFANKHQV